MKTRFYFAISLLLLNCLWFSVLPAEAAPTITVTAAWRPPSQLTSIDANANGITDAGDDIRYATVDIYATVNVEFWAVGFVCTVNKAVLEEYTPNSDPNSTEDNTAMVNRGAAWTILTTSHTVNTVNTDGKINFAISLTGLATAPLGTNGVMENYHIASLKYRVRRDLSAAGSSPFSCTNSFLNRDGRRVVASRFTTPPALSILTGYSLSGNVKYQGITTVPTLSQAISITCDDADGDTVFDDVLTTANVTTGAFSVNNLRTQGRYECRYIPNILNNAASPDAIHLTGRTDFNLSSTSMSLLPVLLYNGNMDTTGLSFNSVDNPDIALVTANWNAPSSLLTAPYMFGDATGDRKINEMDLAIVSNNYNLYENVFANHLIYSVARDANMSFNNHLWLGGLSMAVPTNMGSAINRDYWPAVSPDGRRIAFVRNVGTNGNDKFALFIAPLTNTGLMGAATRVSPANAPYDAFAPAWSPDGSQLAFVCSHEQAWANISNPAGYLCLMEAAGQNFRISLLNGLPMLSRIQAPAWFNSQSLYMAFAPDSIVCENSLCLINIANGNINSSNLTTGVDMPYVRETVLGSTLFYRYNNGAGSRVMRYAELNSSGFPIGAYPTTTVGSIHEDIEYVFPNGGIISNNVAFYTISTGADPHFIYYEDFPSSDDAGGSFFMSYGFSGTSSSPAWNISLGAYRVADALGNPGFSSGYNAAIPNTIAFVP